DEVCSCRKPFEICGLEGQFAIGGGELRIRLPPFLTGERLAPLSNRGGSCHNSIYHNPLSMERREQVGFARQGGKGRRRQLMRATRQSRDPAERQVASHCRSSPACRRAALGQTSAYRVVYAKSPSRLDAAFTRAYWITP